MLYSLKVYLLYMLNIFKNDKKIQLITVSSVLFIGLAGLYFKKSYEELFAEKINHYIEQAKYSFSQSERLFLDEYQQALNTNRLMSQSQVFINYSNTPNAETKKALFDAWNKLAYQQNLFKQVRYIDKNGQELLRINSPSNLNATRSAFELQNKAHRDYFTFAQTLEPGSVGVFGVDLEQEHNEFVIPYAPALRIIIPIFKGATAEGYIVTNYEVETLLDIITHRRNKRLKPEIINPDGSYIIAHNKDHAFGNQLPERAKYNLSNTNPQLWKEIQSNSSGSYVDKLNLYLFHSIELNLKHDDKTFISLKTIPLMQITAQLSLSLEKLIINYLLIVICLFLVIWLYIHNIKNKLQKNEYELINTVLNKASSIIITDESFNILKINQEFLNQTKHAESEILNKTIEEMASDLNRNLFVNTIKPALLKQGYWQGDIQTQGIHKNPINHLLRIQTIHNSRARYIFSFTDITQRKIKEEELKEYSEKDSLTGCWNRRMFDLTLKKETSLVQRYGNHYQSCLAFVDLDHFKKVNDQYGHQRGDSVLQEVAAILGNSFRETDFIARIGGEEFAIILPQIDIDQAYIVFERLREKIQLHFDINVTISGGLIAFSPELTESDLYKACDDLLYQAKNSGRNKIIKTS